MGPSSHVTAEAKQQPSSSAAAPDAAFRMLCFYDALDRQTERQTDSATAAEQISNGLLCCLCPAQQLALHCLALHRVSSVGTCSCSSMFQYPTRSWSSQIAGRTSPGPAHFSSSTSSSCFVPAGQPLTALSHPPHMLLPISPVLPSHSCHLSSVLHPAVCHASQEKEAVSTAAAVETANKKLDPNAFTPGPAVNYNPLQKKVIVTGLMDTRIADNTVGSLGNPALVTGGNGGTRIAYTDGNGQVR